MSPHLTINIRNENEIMELEIVNQAFVCENILLVSLVFMRFKSHCAKYENGIA